MQHDVSYAPLRQLAPRVMMGHGPWFAAGPRVGPDAATPSWIVHWLYPFPYHCCHAKPFAPPACLPAPGAR